ncbi:MAG: response regulator [Proteobacteria bacterium]|nr:response regulator [Pseudomonadota bacterium]MBU1740435.1 response regulator [Pseudomonadota bacterium]
MKPKSDQGMTSKPTILIVDDEPVVVQGCRRVLQGQGYRVVDAENGRIGLEMLERVRPDLVLLDLKMPVMDGLEFLRRALDIDPDQVVVVITGLGTVEAAVEAMKHGAYDLLTKPFTPEQLRLAARRALERIELARRTEELQAQAELSHRAMAAEKGRLRTIVQSMADGILATNVDREIVLLNPAGTKLLLLPQANYLGRRLADIPQLSFLLESVTGVLTGPDQLYLFQEMASAEGAANDEVPPTVMAHVTRVTDDDGELLGTVTVFKDVTPLKELDRMKSEFVAVVAHDLKAPLAVIHQQLTVILEGIAGPINDKQHKLLARARERAENLTEFIKDLLELSRIESGRLVQEIVPVDLAALTAQIVEEQLIKAKARNQDLTFEAPAGLPPVMGDPGPLEEVVINLVSNAVRYTPEGGRIDVALASTGSHLALTVADNGLGISPEDQQRIFERFTRIRTEKTRNIAGTGLGLSIVKEIVEAHHGQITVASQVGEGSTFRVLLPVSEEGRIAS